MIDHEWEKLVHGIKYWTLLHIAKMFLCRPSCAHRSLRALYRPFSKHLYSTLEHDFQSIASKAKPGDLTKLIQNTIKISGAISVADYMRLALTHPLHGYYMQKDVFGVKGDFITSPEISQIFGEVLSLKISRVKAVNLHSCR